MNIKKGKLDCSEIDDILTGDGQVLDEFLNQLQLVQEGKASIVQETEVNEFGFAIYRVEVHEDKLPKVVN